MMKSEVVILTEAGENFGYGHLMRCLAIAQGFKAAGINSGFYIRGNAEPEKILNGFKWSCLEWLKKTPDVQGRIVILDSYYADVSFCEKIYGRAEKVLFIDDYNRIPYPGGFMLNSVICAEEIGYPENNDITYLLGPRFHPLRREFWNVPEKKINREVKKILITFGGTDITNETPEVLRFLKANYPEIEKHVIIGKGFSNLEEIKSVVDERTVLIMHPDAEIMKDEMLECDIAISAAGQTIYELARVGVPTFAKKVVDNQCNIIKNWKAVDFLLEMNYLDGFPNSSLRIRISNLGRGIVDGFGVTRIVEKLLDDYR